jgi:molybdopterin molybdotransferase
VRPVNEAIKACIDLSQRPIIEQRSLALCAGYFLAEDVVANAPLPRWSQSAMDGYAVQAHEAIAGAVLQVGEVIPAGHWPQSSLNVGEAARIFTGAPLPNGADAVVIQENTTYDQASNQVHILKSSLYGDNVRNTGEEILSDAVIANRHQQISPGLLGLCAAQGLSQLPVFTRSKVAIIETGSELISPGQVLNGAQIYATNAVTLVPMIESSFGQVISVSRASDEVSEVVEHIRDTMSMGARIIVTTGGVSVGDFDPIHNALQELGAERTFWKVKMKPGKPISVATLPNVNGDPCILVGLPGNPVSCVVGYLLFLHPLIQSLAGVSLDKLGLRRIKCTLKHTLTKTHSRAELFRVKLSRFIETKHPNQTEYDCELTGGQSSAWVSSISAAHGLLYTPSAPISWQEGDTVEVALFPWVDLHESTQFF